MTNVTIISGFLGAGKTTLIQKLLKEAFQGEKCVLLENEYGEVGIDGGFMKDSGIEITELNSGCICCTLAGDFTQAIGEIVEKFHPDRLIIEPSGVGKLSDIRRVVEEQEKETGLIHLTGSATVVDAGKCKMYLKNFGEFFEDQVKCAETVVFSRTQKVSEEKLETAYALVRSLNAEARLISTPWDNIGGKVILDAIEHPEQLIDVNSVAPAHHHHHHHDHDENCGCHDHEHHHHEHDEHCECGCHDHEHEHHHHEHDEHCECGCHDHEHEHHHHEHDEHCECGCHDHEHEHHHHEHDEHCECGCHDHEHEHHHHEHDEHCECGCHDHEHEHHHHHHDHHGHGCSCGHDHDHDADEVFENIGVETVKKIDKATLENALKTFEDEEKYGVILRMKGILESREGGWIHFDYTPGEYEIRNGSADYTGRLCIIGVDLKKEAILKELGM
ncbi:MAG: GTP-binding protein [Clostridia bacterium]|nr:GTP-binding protein [Clostridia bacterium]